MLVSFAEALVIAVASHSLPRFARAPPLPSATVDGQVEPIELGFCAKRTTVTDWIGGPPPRAGSVTSVCSVAPCESRHRALCTATDWRPVPCL